MKKIILLLSVGLLCLTSCDKFLEESPKSSITDVDYYTTEAQATANVNYLYRNGAPRRISYASSAYIGPKVSITGMLTGYFSNSYEGQEVVCKYSRLLTRQDHTNEISDTSDDIWDNCYNAINVANTAIASIPSITMESSTSEQLTAEAKFFRAFNYFFLVKTFGDVPLLLEPTTLDNLYPERTAAATVYQQIETDLQDAISVLPAEMFASNGHRISKYVAAMVLTDVYFHQGDYANAKTYAKIVVDSPHSLTENTDMTSSSAYNILRSTDDLDEVIYCQEYDASISTSSWWPTYCFSSSATAIFGTYSIFERVYGPIDQFLNVYESTDLRIQPNQFFHWDYTNPDNGKTWTAPEGQAGCWYYYDEDALLSTGKGTKDWNFYRLAEAYLDYAESIAQTDGVTSDAAEYLAQVQARANTEGKTVAEIKTELQALSQSDFIETCWTERIREFPLEFKIWDDCVRTMKFPVISETEAGVVSYVDLIGASNAAGATFKQTDLVFPISLSELQRNPNLVQNDGYASK
ncbi:RagB/SusD family nutrient uptake outer membrane protein [Mangrovibacterium diazotrophicum]|uniref:Putative outer membrane starch-binding protein n=1 Tax=Mangrovibacterium diazotrophicum TaxID=1261403 RepID=A0A419VY86_9BACT|nr:RagB/SusD family nutrient uptake outer membrane protein [Mangrovibacterium diazotrophicum]RKD88168.1 putative outer membrane starch-binding protein [Mangrovibacterium diazotrophicum]